MMDRNTKIIEDRIAAYNAQLKGWDSKLDQLDAKVRIAYEQERDHFSGEMAEAWKNLTAAKIEQYLTRFEVSYQKLKAKWQVDGASFSRE